jgi:hypothetical protein
VLDLTFGLARKLFFIFIERIEAVLYISPMQAIINPALKEKLKETKHPHDGIQYIFQFDNGYGASVVRHKYSYGSEKGRWELAVLDEQGNIVYNTPITQDVLGWLEWERVLDTLYAISQLTEANK